MSVEVLRVSAHTQQRDAAIEERRLSLRARASEVLRVENQGACACQDERRETLQTCGPNIVDLSTTRPLSTSRTGTDWIASRTVPSPRSASAGDSEPTCCTERNQPTTNPLAHSEETVT